ncbi:hypothetical protein [Euzebya tangerina]|nr:hypothetical protein [Euzebya tangerina]
MIVDPSSRRVHWFQRGDQKFVTTERSAVLELTAGELAGPLDWPPT